MQARKRASEHKQTEIEKVVAEIRGIEAEIEDLRQQHAEETEKFNDIQGNYYKLGGEISRVEQSIHHVKELNSRYDEELKEVQQAWAQAEQALNDEQSKAAELEVKIREIEPLLHVAREELNSNTQKLSEAESRMASWQAAWEVLTSKVAEPTQTVEVEASRIEYLNERLQQLDDRKYKLLEDQHQFGKYKETLESKDLISRVDETSTTLKVISPKMQDLNEKISVGRDTGQALAAQLERAREKLQSIQAQLASLQALQRVVLGDEGQAVSKWLEHKGLSKAPRLMDKIKTEPGWEAAVETILGDYLEAVCVKDIEQTASSLDSIKTGRLMVLDQSRANQAAIIEGTLVAKVTSPVDLSDPRWDRRRLRGEHRWIHSRVRGWPLLGPRLGRYAAQGQRQV